MANGGISLTDTMTRIVATGRSSHAPAVRPQQTTASSSSVGGAAQPPRPKLPDLREQIASINRMLREQRSNLSFSVDEGTGKTVVRVVRQSTGEVIRQIPSEEALAIATHLRLNGSLSSLGVETWS